MKILLISGSPHKAGTTSVLIKAFSKGAESAGHEVYHFNAGEKEVHPCIACEKCHSAVSACVFRDAFDEIRDMLIEADAVVFASPIYYYGLTAQLKAVIDRFYGIDEQLRTAKKTALLLACGDNTMESAECAASPFYGMVDYLGWEIADVIAAKGCYTAEDVVNTEYPEQAYELGRTMLGVPQEEEATDAASSLEELVARFANFSDLAEEIIRETQEKEGFLEGYND